MANCYCAMDELLGQVKDDIFRAERVQILLELDVWDVADLSP